MDTTLTAPARRPRGKPPAHLIIPIDVLVDMFVRQKMGITEIAEKLNITRQTVSDRLQRHGISYLGIFKENRKDIFALMQRNLMNSITDSEIKKMPVRDRIVSTGILYDKEHGNPVTHSIDVTGISRQLDELKAKRDLLAKQLERLGEPQDVVIDVTPDASDNPDVS